MLIKIIITINWAILCYFIILSFCYIILLVSSIPDIMRRFKEEEIGNIIPLMRSYSLPPISIIIPTFNEQSNILETVQSILGSSYQNIFIIIVNAGSRDKTLPRLLSAYNLIKVSTPIIQMKIPTSDSIKNYYVSQTYPNITVIDTVHTDRSDTLNIGINVSLTPLFITVDADTLVEPETISNIAYYMLSKAHMVAVGGAVYILNGCTFKDGKILSADMSLKPIYAFQTCEYLRSFLFNRCGWNSLGGALCYAGALTLFNHNMVVEVGGYDLFNKAQDFEIITHIHANRREEQVPYQIGFTPTAVVWTDVPGTLKAYWRQRFNWQYATLQSLTPYMRMLFNPKYGIVGLFTFPFFLFGEALGALVEFSAYCLVVLCWYLGILDLYWAALFFILCLGFISFLTMATALINFVTFNKYNKLRNLMWMLLFTLIEPFGFRQFNVLCRTTAIIYYFAKKLKFWK